MHETIEAVPISGTSVQLAVVNDAITYEQYESELAVIADSDRALALLVQSRRMLGEAKTVQVAKDIRDRAEALKAYSAQKEVSLEVQNILAEISSRATRRIGELLAATPDAKPGPKNNSVDGNDSIPSLKEIGITKDLSSTAQQLAAVPEEKFDQALESQKEEGKVITTAATLRLIKAKPAAKIKHGVDATHDVQRAVDILKTIPKGAQNRRTAFFDLYLFLRRQYPDLYPDLFPHERKDDPCARSVAGEAA